MLIALVFDWAIVVMLIDGKKVKKGNCMWRKELDDRYGAWACPYCVYGASRHAPTYISK